MHRSRETIHVAGAALEPLLEQTGAPVTAQWWWVREWFDTHRQWQPLCIVVEDGGRVVGGAALAARRRAGIVEVVPAGFGQSDYPWLPALPGAEERTATAIVAGLAAAGRAWRFLLYEIPEGDAVTTALVRLLRHCDQYPGIGAPVVDLRGYDPRRDVSANARKRVRQSRNRLSGDGRRADFAVVATPDALEAVISEVQALHVERDHDARGESDLDAPERAAFWRAALRAAARRGCLEIATMRVDGDLAGHLVGFCDGPAFRVWDARFSPRYGRYSPGHLLRDEVLTRLLADGRFEVFDWMRGIEAYKMQSATRVVATTRVRAWSHGWLATAERVARRLRPAHDVPEAEAGE